MDLFGIARKLGLSDSTQLIRRLCDVQFDSSVIGVTAIKLSGMSEKAYTGSFNSLQSSIGVKCFYLNNLDIRELGIRFGCIRLIPLVQKGLSLYMDQNKFLYRYIHSLHHHLLVPCAFGALYNHPTEGLLLDTIGGALSFLLSGNLFQVFFKNNLAYHDVHLHLYGSKYNFAQPLFVMWDRILGTYMPYSLEKRAGRGFEARPMKDFKDD